MSTLPERIGRYEIVGRLAMGGMAEILLARLLGPRGFENLVVVKRILPHLALLPEFVDMFVDEAGIVAGVRHRNVVHVHELGHDGDDLYLVLEYLEGESVGGIARRLWSRGETLDRRLGAHVIAEACAGVHAAHELCDAQGKPRGLVHRDVSPHNVFVTYQGEVKVLDFGIAKADKRHTKTEAGQLKGKIAYMSPEQCHARPLDRRSDVFALGTLLYELTTSRRLFAREGDLAMLKAITEEPVPRPSEICADYPKELERICLRALERRREDRYATAADMRRDLLAAIPAIGPEGLPEEELVALMRSAFADRMEEKREMARRARAAGEMTEVPAPEADETVDLPVAASEATATMATFSGAQRHEAPKRRALVGVLAIGLGAIAGLAWWWPRAAVAPMALDYATLPMPASVAESPRLIVIRLETTPSGASVLLDGRAKGSTPISLPLEEGADPVLVELRHNGFETWSQRLVPDSDQRIVVSLKPEPSVRRAPAPPASSPAAAPPAAPPPAPAPAPRPAPSGYLKL